MPDSKYKPYTFKGIPFVKGEKGEVPIRQEIDAWANQPCNRQQRDLFLLALWKFQAIDEKKSLSYFQIAGIHGLPSQSWPHPQEDKTGDREALWYCTHSSTIFPTWHRPYLLLFEQLIYESMVAIINDPEKQYCEKIKSEYTKLAEEWRLPYWDFALTRGSKENKKLDIPELLKSAKINVIWPDGTPEEIDNPLFRYEFNKKPNPQNQVASNETQERNERGSGPQKPPKIEYDNMSTTIQYKWPYFEGPNSPKKTLEFPPKFTVRHPRSKMDYIEGVQKNDVVANGLNDVAQILRDEYGKPLIENGNWIVDKVNSTLTSSSEWSWFATNTVKYSGKSINEAIAQQRFGDGTKESYLLNNSFPLLGPMEYQSVEDVHNAVHNICGGNGHMGNPGVAAFDPIFWLHHTNIDRLCAIWQALHPTAWFYEGKHHNPSGYKDGKKEGKIVRQYEATFAIKRSVPRTQETGLAPFKISADSWYTSKDVRYCTNLGYTYPELQRWLFKTTADGGVDEEEYQKAIHVEIDTLYPHFLEEFMESWVARFKIDGMVQGVTEEVYLSRANLVVVRDNSENVVSVEYDDYVVNIEYERNALGERPFLIDVHIGGFPDGEGDYWLETDIKVGNVYNFVGGAGNTAEDMEAVPGPCANCNEHAKNRTIVAGQVPLTRALYALLEDHKWMRPKGQWYLSSLWPKVVERELTNQLSWKVKINNGTELAYVDLATSPLKNSLRVSVARTRTTFYKEKGKAAKHGKAEYLLSVTKDKLGGVGYSPPTAI